ncbi:MAG: hypothetical protein QOE84_2534, partial [Actinomycetota bacterium]|nr:hypothetical protein [Actinomycetota bacterium]
MSTWLRSRPESLALLLALPVLLLLPGSTPYGVYGLGVVSAAVL